MNKAFLQLHLAVFLAGFTAVLGRLISLNEGLLVWYRLLITIIVMAVILVIEKRFIKISKKALLQMVGVGAVIAFHWVTFYGSIKYGNISVALVCLSSAGFFSSLLEPLFLQKKIIFAEVLLGLLAIIGIYIIFDFHPQFKLGIIYGILGALGAAIFPIFNKQLLQKYSPRTLTFYELAGGFVVLSFVLPLYLKSTNQVFSLPDATDIGWLLILAIVCTVICFDLQLKALQKISAFTCNLMYNLEPLYGICLAFMFFGEGAMFSSKINFGEDGVVFFSIRAFYVGLTLVMAAVVLQMIRLSIKKNKV